ncbi:MAG TPA: AAA family ATPase [Marmoricola sp.]|nr:AAA family ATPase [Marmoricola sp.]
MRSTRLVGRVKETDELRHAVELARDGRPAFRLVDGEAGIGKTRLVTDVVCDLAQPGDLVAVGHSVAMGGSTLPYGVAADLVRDLVRQVGVDRVTAEGGAALTALTATREDPSARPRTPGAITAGFVAVVERLAQDRLVCLVFEDVHWSDDASRELIDHLLRGIGPCRLLVVCTRRTHDAPVSSRLQQFVAELVRHPRADRVTLQRLDGDQVAEQVADILGRRPAPSELDRIVALGQGIPYLTEELVSAPAEIAPVGDVMLARVNGLSPAARRLVHAAAVGEGQLWHALLGRACGLPDSGVDGAMTEVVAAFVLEPDESRERYRFRHALLREAVLSSLLPEERQRWHRRWAETLAADAGAMPAATAQIAVAHHWWQTDDVVRAFDAAVVAEEAAESIGASSEAAVQCQRLLELWPRVPDATSRTILTRQDYAWTARGALLDSGGWAAALALAERELAHPDARADPVWRIHLELSRSDLAQQLGERVRKTADVDADVEALLAAPPDSNLLTQTLVQYGVRLRDRGRLREAERLFDRAAEVSAVMTAPELLATGSPAGVATATREGWRVEAVRASQEWAGGFVERALQRLSRLQPEALSAGFDGLDPRIEYAWFLNGAGRHREAAAVARGTVRVIEHPRLNRALWVVAVAPLLEALLALGEWDETQRWLDVAADVQPAGISAEHLAFITARLALGRGDLDIARGAIDCIRPRTSDDADDVGGPAIWWHWVLAEVAAAGGQDAVARKELDAVWAGVGWREMHLDAPWEALVLAVRLEADRPAGDAEARLAVVRELAAEMNKAGDLGVAWSTQLEAELLRTAGSLDPGPWEATVAAWSRIGQLHAEGWALVRQAACQVAVGLRSPAGEALGRALATGHRLGARPLLDAVAGLARRARIDLGLEPGGPGSLPLTGREIEVLRLVAGGRSNSQIASELYISPKTASVHVSHILTKLDVHTRTEAAAVAFRHNLLDDADRRGPRA